MPVVGYLGFGSPKGFATRLTAFRQGLRETGYREGENVALEYRWAEGENTRLPALAADLVSHGVTVIATPGSANAARAAKSATTTIPIVFETGADPVATGLVTSLNRPSGNITGVVSLNVEVGQKRLEVLRELLPTATIVAGLVNPINANAEMVTRDLKAAARTLGLQIHILHASSEHDLDAAFTALGQLRADALVVNPDPFFFSQKERLVDLTLQRQVTTMFFSRNFVAAGGLMSYGGSVSESHRHTGIYTGRILKGEKPGDLPVQQVTKFEFVINSKTAKARGLSMPLAILARADEVIE
jgi:putative ABC transport system substrate-binding protein